MNKKTQKRIGYKGYFLSGVLLLTFFIYKVDALSFKDMIPFAKNDSEGVAFKRKENLQNIKFLESDKDIAHAAVPESSYIDGEVGDTLLAGNNLDNTHSQPYSDTQTSSDAVAVYTVQKGDSIYSIASYFGVSVETILTFNKMTSKAVSAGDILEIPSISGILYSVKKGDTLKKISDNYKVDQDDVSLYNGLFNAELAVGDEIFLPGAVDKKLTETKKTTTKTTTKTTVKYARGDTSHLNTKADINKYSSLPQYSNYYIFPSPGATRTQKMHGNNGVDLGNKLGAPVVASAGGTVRVAKSDGYNFGYGKYIIITHGNGSETIYAHLSAINVIPGQQVGQGEQIGKVGSTGNSTGPHLHFEVRGAYNPFAW